MNRDFEKFAISNGVNSNGLRTFEKITSAYINPTILEEHHLNVAAIDVFSRLLYDRIVFLGTEIDDTVANIINAQLLYLSSLDPDKDICLYLNTPGGSVTDGLAIYDTMHLIKPKVGTVCTGMAASMGSILLCGGEKGYRKILPHSRVLIHQPLGGAKGQASDILIAAKEIEKSKNELCEILALNTGQPFEKVMSDIDRDYWMTSSEAKEYGMVDEIL